MTNVIIQEKSALLENVSFKASPGELTAVLAKEIGERRTIMELVAGRRSYGEFDGDVFFHGGKLQLNFNNVAYVSKVTYNY
jgi:Fe-S cluster assembly ATPase SufC